MRDYGDWCRRPEDFIDDDAIELALVIAAVSSIMLVLYSICD